MLPYETQNPSHLDQVWGVWDGVSRKHWMEGGTDKFAIISIEEQKAELPKFGLPRRQISLSVYPQEES